MASYCKFIYSSVTFVLLVVVIMTAANPERSKIRIHVPVKHHTHYHTVTKTIIKPIHVPIKKHHHVDEEPILHKHYDKHHRNTEVDEDEEMEDWAELYAKKKKFHPFI